MFYDQLINFGALGIWTIFNITTILYYRKKETTQGDRLLKVIENNTIAVTKVYEVIRLCPQR